jgi:ATP/maltotriose-dependent transcriptional regulator MalT
MALAIQEKAHYALYAGMFEEAMSHLKTIKDLIGEGDEVAVIPLRMELLGLTSMVHLRCGEYEEAQDAAQRSLDLTIKANPSFYAAITGYTGPAEVYLTLWEDQPSNQNLARQAKLAVQTLGKYARVFPIGVPHLLLAQGRYHWLTGKKKQAQRAWQFSLQDAKQLGMLYNQALAHYEIARHLVSTDPVRQDHISLALSIFSKLNAVYDLERAQKL